MPNLRVTPCCSATPSRIGCITRADIRDACLTNPAARPPQDGYQQIASISRLACFLLVLAQPSSQRPRRPFWSERKREPCRQVILDRLVVPSFQEAKQCVDGWWCARFGFTSTLSVSASPALRQTNHPAAHSFHQRATCRGSLAAVLAAKTSRGAARLSTHTRLVSTGRAASASQRASSSRQVTTIPAAAWSRCDSQEHLPRRAEEAMLSLVDPHDE